jgi:uncharacterized protein DUF4279
MPGCILRVTGESFDVDAFLEKSPFKPDIVYRKGQRRRPASRGTQKASGFNVVISQSENPDEQVRRALKFLRENRPEMLRLMRAKGIDQVTVDLSCPQREFTRRVAHLPNELLSAAGAYGIDIDVSFYLVG